MTFVTDAAFDRRFNAARRWAPVALIALGIGVRLAVWAGNRSLWVDEATVAIGLLWKPFLATWGVHDFGQISPPGWLLLVHLAADLFGPSEQALRLPTLLFGVGYLPAVWLLFRRLAGERIALIALALTAVSPALAEYAVELKAYGGDPLVTVAVIAVLLHLAHRPVLSARRALGCGVAVGLTCWFSSAAIVVVAAGLPAVVLSRGWRVALSADLRSRILFAAVVGGLIAVVYFGHLSLEPWLRGYVTAFWRNQFLDPGSPDLAYRLWTATMSLVSPTVFGHGGDLIPGLLLIPIWYGIRWVVQATDGRTAVILIGPLPVLAALAVFRVFPIAPRLGLFLAPIVTLFLAAGLVSWIDATRRRWIPGLAIGLIVLMPAAATVRLVLDPIRTRAHARPLLEEMARLRRADEVTYVFARGAPEWLYYTTDWRDPDRDRIAMFESEYRFPDGLTAPSGLARGRPPDPIGDQLRYRYRGAAEVYGQYSGFIARTADLEHREPDPGWADAERERIVRGNPPCLWLIVLHGARQERRALEKALELAGYRDWTVLTSAGSLIQRGCRASGVAPSGGGL
ncbi:MAG: glycosyltransferase family 39 protein [Gemmatimonadales bacterium]